MAAFGDDLIRIAEEIAELKYRNAEKEIELQPLRICVPKPKAEEDVHTPFTDDESDGESVLEDDLEDFLYPDRLGEVLEWLRDYPNVFVSLDESKGIFYLTGKMRTLKRMAKHPLYQEMLNIVIDKFGVYKVKIMPLD
jgi:hypothetical protein